MRWPRRPCFGLLLPLLACATSAVPPPTAMVVNASSAPGTAPVPLTPEAALARAFSADTPDAEWFAPSFLAAVPAEKIAALAKQLHAKNGAFKSVHADGGHWIVVLERGTLRADARLDADGRFVGLLIRPLTMNTATLDEALADFRALPGQVSVVVVSDGEERGVIAPDAPLAVGSAFKLATLVTLRAAIDAKARRWTDVVELPENARSLPTGVMQDWPVGAPVTLYTLAALMISISDNTATDALIGLQGREVIEAWAPHDRPYLTTRELFVLKAPENAALLARFRSGDERARRSLLEDLRQHPLPKPETYPRTPTAPDVEWFFTTRELCALMGKVHDLPLMSINVGPTERSDWDGVAYKGGSEPGVLNMTTWVTKGKHAHCVSATWNAPRELDALAFVSAYTRVLTWLKARP